GPWSLPNRIYVWHLVRQKFDEVETKGHSQNNRMREHLQFFGQMNDAVAFQQAQGGYRGVEIQAGRKSRPQHKTKRFDRIHSNASSTNLHSASSFSSYH